MNMLFTRQLRRFVARLLIGMLFCAQLALAAHACPPFSPGTVDTSQTAMMASVMLLDGAGAAPSLTAQMDSDQPEMCSAHCLSGHQNIDVKPAPSPMLALMAGYFTLEPSAQGGGHGWPEGPAESPAPPADLPHAILHCCLRL